jgi:hypothetical protein
MAAPIDPNGGRPLKFKTIEELQSMIDEYFEYCDSRIKEVHTKEGDVIAITHPAPYTMSGLARRLGVTRQTLVNYGNRELFFDTIKEARDKVQEDIETRLMETSNQSGAIFNLKNNFDWKDKREVEHDVTLDTTREKIGAFLDETDDPTDSETSGQEDDE